MASRTWKNASSVTLGSISLFARLLGHSRLPVSVGPGLMGHSTWQAASQVVRPVIGDGPEEKAGMIQREKA